MIQSKLILNFIICNLMQDNSNILLNRLILLKNVL